jgi:signal peptidase I
MTLDGARASSDGRELLRAAVSRVLRVLQAAIGTCLALTLLVVLCGIAPTFFGYESFTVYSGSMEPAIRVGALAVVQPVPSSRLKPGDVITYRMPFFPDVIVTHRLLAIQQTPDGKTQYRTKGDANAAEDLVQVDPNAVLGRVAYSVPYAGYIVEYSKTGVGRLVLIALPAALLALDFLRQRMRRPEDVAAGSVAAGAAGGAATARPRPTVRPAPRAVSGLSTEARIDALLDRGQAALAAGHADLAGRAADGVLVLDPRSEDAWLLKTGATADPGARLTLLRTAAVLIPDAPRVAAALAMAEVASAEHGGGSRVSVAAPG